MAPHRGRRRDVDAGQGTLLLGNVILVAYLMESSSIIGLHYRNRVRSREDSYYLLKVLLPVL